MNKNVILIIGFNRPVHLKYCLDAVFKSKSVAAFEFIFILDCALNENISFEYKECKKIFDLYLIKAKSLGVKARFIDRKINLGLKKNIISAINKEANSYHFVVVLEDDIIVNRYFFDFILKYQHLLKEDSAYGCISGNLPFSFSKENSATEAISHFYMNCWGWAGSTISFKNVIFDPAEAYKIFKKLSEKKRFNFYNKGTSKWQLKANLSGKKNTWAVYWYLYLFSKNQKTIYPSRSLTLNIGNDGSGVNSGKTDILTHAEIMKFTNAEHFFLQSSYVKEDSLFDKKYFEYIKTEKPNILNRIYNKFIYMSYVFK